MSKEDFLGQIEEQLRNEGISFKRVEHAIFTSFRDGEISYDVMVFADKSITIIVGKTNPPLIPTADMAEQLLEDNFRLNFASYHLDQDNEVIVTSFLRNECIKDSFKRNFYITLSFLKKLGENLATR